MIHWAERWRRADGEIEVSNHGGLRRVWYFNGVKQVSEAHYALSKTHEFSFRSALRNLLFCVENAIQSGDWDIKAACNPEPFIDTAKAVLEKRRA